MAVVKYGFRGKEGVQPISSSTRVGRHWSNDIQLDHPNIPMYWIEIRWIGSKWCWRSLSARDRTRGKGAVIDDIWKELTKKGTIRLDGVSKDIFSGIECINDQKPELMLEDLLDRKWYFGENALKYIEVWSEGKIIPIDDIERKESLDDGDVFVSRDRVFRLHCLQDMFFTNVSSFDINDSDVFLEIDLRNRKACFIYGQQEVKVQGVAVLTLATYAKAILEEMPWISTSEAFEYWVILGGAEKSGASRLGWERGRVRNQLSQQRCSGLKELFQSRRIKNIYEMRLCLSKEQISFVEDL